MKVNKTFVNDIFNDEMRSGYLVTSHKKKLWNVQLGLINEFARVCKKYDIKWFAFFGTLLGAARHKGFIPWDDDVDLMMLRPEFEKFKKVAETEIKQPYFLDLFYNYRRESDEVLNIKSEEHLPLITLEYENKWILGSAIAKLKDSRTTMIEPQNLDMDDFNHGIYIDIFPFDPLPPFSNDQQIINHQLSKELLIATIYPNLIRNAISNGQQTVFPADMLQKVINLPYRQRGIIFEDFLTKNFTKSDYVGMLTHSPINAPTKDWERTYETKYLEEVDYLPFENIQIPVPANYDEILTHIYGDWREPILSHIHVMDYSADIPFEQYIKAKQNIKIQSI